MNNQLHCDLAIIGAGAGGLSLAAGASQLGLKVILIEQGLMGGDCLNYGCIPSKSLIAAAESYWQINHHLIPGIPNAKPYPLDFKKITDHVKKVIEKLSVHDSVERFEELGVRVIKATGQFINQQTLQAGTNLIKAKRFVIATGSSATIPPIPGLDEVTFYTNETLFDLTELPSHLIIIGGGPIGCELAQAFAMLGSKVTLLEGINILSHDDTEAADVIRQALIQTGVLLKEQFKVNHISNPKNGKIIIQGEQKNTDFSIEGSHLLIATGRTPNVTSLHCDNANIQFDKKGIIVDSRLRTSNKKIFAIGDVTGKLQFTHIANDHAGVVLRNIAFKLPAKVQENAIPWVTYTSPELAQAGKSEAACISSDISHSVLKLEYSCNDRAQTNLQTTGFIKVIVTPGGKILGVTIVGYQAGELLLPWIIAIREGKTLRVFTDTIVAYPTLSELSKRIASQFYAPKLFSSKVKKLVKFLNYFS